MEAASEDGGGELPGESFVDYGGRHVVHLLDVQGELEAFVLLVVVRREDSRVVSVMRHPRNQSIPDDIDRSTMAAAAQPVTAAAAEEDGSDSEELPGQSFVADYGGRHVVQFVDVQDELEAFMLQVVVRQADSRIVFFIKL